MQELIVQETNKPPSSFQDILPETGRFFDYSLSMREAKVSRLYMILSMSPAFRRYANSSRSAARCICTIWDKLSDIDPILTDNLGSSLENAIFSRLMDAFVDDDDFYYDDIVDTILYISRENILSFESCFVKINQRYFSDDLDWTDWHLSDLFDSYGDYKINYEIIFQNKLKKQVFVLLLLKLSSERSFSIDQLERFTMTQVGFGSLSLKDGLIILKMVRRAGSVSRLLEDKQGLLYLVAKVERDIALVILHNILGVPKDDDDTDHSEEEETPRRETDRRLSIRSKTIFDRQQNYSSKLMALFENRPISEETREVAKLGSDLIQNPSGIVNNLDSSLIETTGVADDSYLAITELVDKLQAEILNLPEEAQSFTIFHQAFGRTKMAPGLIVAMTGRLHEYYIGKLNENLQGLTREKVIEIIEDALNLYGEALEHFTYVVTTVVPQLKMMVELVNQRFYSEGVWFSGRDGVPLYMAFKAAHFGEPLGARRQYAKILQSQILRDSERKKRLINFGCKLSKVDPDSLNDHSLEDMFEVGLNAFLDENIAMHELLKFVSLSRPLLENMDATKSRENIIALLVKKGINPELLAVDTGRWGTVVREAMEIMGEFSQDKLFRWGEGGELNQAYDVIEELPKQHERTIAILEKGVPVNIPRSTREQFLYWVTNQAISSSFLPRRNAIEDQLSSSSNDDAE